MSEFKVNAKLLFELRSATDLPITDCKEALIESKNDLKEAHKILKIKGLAKAERKSANKAREGHTKVLINGNKAIIAELNCQSEQVADLLEFKNLLNQISVMILHTQPSTIEAALQLKTTTSGETLANELKHNIAKLGENIVLSRFKCLTKKADETFGYYIHAGGKYSSLVIVKGVTKNNDFPNDIARQLVAANAKFIDMNDIPTSFREQELEIIKTKTLTEENNKKVKLAPNILENIIKGRINKFLSELTLVDQPYSKDPSIKVKDYLSKNNVKIIAMVRYQLGESIDNSAK